MDFPWLLLVTSSLGVIFLGHSAFGFKRRRGWVASFVLGLALILGPLLILGLDSATLFSTAGICVLLGLGPALIWWAILLWINKRPWLAVMCVAISFLLMALLFGFGPQLLQEMMDSIESYPQT